MRNFGELDELMKYCNKEFGKEYNIEFIYSTPNKFVSAIRAEKIEWPAYRADFFPY